MTEKYRFETENYIYNVASAAKTKFRTGSFYVRYFKSAAGSGPHRGQQWRLGTAQRLELRGPLPRAESEPSQSRLNGTSATGQSDASRFCSPMLSVYDDVGPFW